MQKHHRWVFCLAAYLTAWAMFGVAYWVVGQNPDNYAVQQEVLLKHRTQRFLERTGMTSPALEAAGAALPNVYDGSVGLLAGWYDGTPDGAVPNFTVHGYQGIGDAWAAYYCAKYRALGAGRFSCVLREGMDSRYVHLDVSLLSWAGQTPVGAAGLELPVQAFGGEAVSWTGMRRKALLQGGSHPLALLRDLLSLSVFYPDGDIFLLWAVEQEGARLGLSDFLYFSAVTIATLGYGEIVPNCFLARFLVLLETLVGMTLFAVFASAVYDFWMGWENRKRGA